MTPGDILRVRSASGLADCLVVTVYRSAAGHPWTAALAQDCGLKQHRVTPSDVRRETAGVWTLVRKERPCE